MACRRSNSRPSSASPTRRLGCWRRSELAPNLSFGSRTGSASLNVKGEVDNRQYKRTARAQNLSSNSVDFVQRLTIKRLMRQAGEATDPFTLESHDGACR